MQGGCVCSPIQRVVYVVHFLSLCLQVATLWGSFEIKNVRLAKTLLKQYSGYVVFVAT